MLRGSCNCGACGFEAWGKVWSVSACHCGQCRKQSGNCWASAVTAKEDIRIRGAVRWYASSEEAERGFCPKCGCFLFWRAHAESSMSFALGALDGDHALKIEKHIFTADKGSYYNIADDLPQHET